MADNTHIEWTDATWNPITGCSVVSPGCTNCYAMKLAGTRLKHHPSRSGLTVATKAGPVWNGEVRLNEGWLGQPLRWRRPRRIFVCAHGDLFHEDVPDAWIDQTFAVMALALQHTFQVLTKRSARMRQYLSDPKRIERMLEVVVDHPTGRRPLADLIDMVAFSAPLPNVWLGVSAEDQARFDVRVADLRATPAAIRFISAEPLLGPIRAKEGLMGFGIGNPADCACGHGHGFDRCPNYGKVAKACHRCACTDFTRRPGAGGIHLMIVGGENGPRAMHPAWVRSLLADCQATGTAFFFKQWGSWLSFDHESPCVSTDPVTGSLVVKTDGRRYDRGDVVAWNAPYPVVAARVGKAIAGRMLDGVLHDAMPGATA